MTRMANLTDSFGRHVSYLRLSVTDRCDFRCVYCMAEDMTFLPRSQVLSLEELGVIARTFVALGVRKIRITGGEPLVRKDILTLCEQLGQLGLDDLGMTTNGSRLTTFARPLAEAGLHRVNISLDSLQPERFRRITRTGDLHSVLKGIAAAQTAGFRRVKLNCVVMKNRNADEIHDLVAFAVREGLDITFIEEMPLGVITSHNRAEEFLSSAAIRQRLQERWQLQPAGHASGGPARYWAITGSESLVGFISPHSHNFCDTCNRVRVSVEGKLLLCLGNDHSADLKAVLRAAPPGEQHAALQEAIIAAMTNKPARHHFELDQEPQIVRFMNATGG